MTYDNHLTYDNQWRHVLAMCRISFVVLDHPNKLLAIEVTMEHIRSCINSSFSVWGQRRG